MYSGNSERLNSEQSLISEHFWWNWAIFYNINYMLNSEHLSLVNKIGDKTEFTITRIHCTLFSALCKKFKFKVHTYTYDKKELRRSFERKSFASPTAKIQERGHVPLVPWPWTIIGPTWLDIFKLGLLQIDSFTLHSLKFAICFYGNF